MYKRQSPNNYGTISRGDGEVWGVRGSVGMTRCNICIFETRTNHFWFKPWGWRRSETCFWKIKSFIRYFHIINGVLLVTTVQNNFSNSIKAQNIVNISLFVIIYFCIVKNETVMVTQTDISSFTIVRNHITENWLCCYLCIQLATTCLLYTSRCV